MLLIRCGEDRAISERVAAELTEVEARFSAQLISDLPCVNTLVEHVERYRGKMLRPMLVLVAGMATAKDRQELTDAHIIVATVVEMVHMATLVHDDVLDDAKIRRGGATINHLKGNEAAVMLGDYLISHAYHLCSKLNSTLISRMIADTTNTVCEGELLQLTNRGNADLDERTYFEIIRRKTGTLCGTCCLLGSQLSGAQDKVTDCLVQYGEKMGTAFQVVDDLLDMVGREDTVGKTLGRDLQKGKLTLPVIHFLKSAGTGDRKQLKQLLETTGQGKSLSTGNGSTMLSKEQIDQIKQMLVENRSVDYAMDWASRLIDQAKASLNCLGNSSARTLLLGMADKVLTRKF